MPGAASGSLFLPARGTGLVLTPIAFALIMVLGATYWGWLGLRLTGADRRKAGAGQKNDSVLPPSRDVVALVGAEFIPPL
jgi:threonine/homoserine/homoserine lactone efflux protein